MTDTELELPQGWVETEFRKIVKSISLTGKKLKQKEYLQSGKFPVIDQGQDFIGGFTDKKELVVECKLPVIVFGDHTKIVKFVNQIFVVGADGVKVLEPNLIFIPKLLYYFIHALPLPNKGYARHYQHLEKLMIKIPPLNEQKRIISKIEELFSKVDSTKQSLDKIKLQLEQYRYSYHNWIFHGNFKEKFNFSSNWEEKPLGKIFKIIGGGTPDTKKSQYWDGNIPWITSADIHGIKNIIPRRRVSQLGIDNSATHKIPPNSILVVTRVGLGKLAITSEPICINQDIQAVIIDSNIVLPLFVLNYLSQTIQIFRFRNQGTTISGVTKKQLADIPFFLPSLDEQEKIIGHMEMAEARIQNSKSIVNSTLQNLQTMKMSVLKQAFEGKLVPQDPNDEPASVLLEKIKLKN